MKVAVYIGNRYGAASPREMDNRNEWHETELTLKGSEVIKGIAFGKPDSPTVGPTEIGTVIFYENINNLVGKLLTLSDAVFSDLDQRKAHKELVTQTLWDWFHAQEPQMSAFQASKMPSWDKSGGKHVHDSGEN